MRFFNPLVRQFAGEASRTIVSSMLDALFLRGRACESLRCQAHRTLDEANAPAPSRYNDSDHSSPQPRITP